MNRIRSQEGTALITAILVMTAMLVLSLPAVAYLDGQHKASGSQRSSESAFNLTEAVLETQVFLLSRNWPGVPARARPAACTSSAVSAGCPDRARLLAATSTSPDLASGAAWSTTIRDNGGPVASFYSDADAATQPTWDANADGRMWVRAQATARGRTRTIVALVQIRAVDLSLMFPHNVITAGWAQTTNAGHKVIVDTKGTAAQPAPVAVRCTTRDSGCLGYEPEKGQIAPDTTETGYGGGSALDAERLDALRVRAIAAGSYHASGCPANPSGPIVFVERGDCSYTNSAGPCCNSADAPGIFVIADGTLALGGNIQYHGIVYLANMQGSGQAVLSIEGTAAVVGAVAVDGSGGVVAGASGTNIAYAKSAYNHLFGYDTASIVQNTWRELTP